MRLSSRSALSILPLYAPYATADRYAGNQNPVVIDSPQIAANFPDIDGVEFFSPAFLHPETIPPTWSNGTSGPTPQSTLEIFVKDIASRNSYLTYHSELFSEESRSIPYLTLSNNATTTPKLRIWIQGGQHGDEPAGDQGVLSLLGKLTSPSHSTYLASILAKIDLVILPRYNADGVEYFQRQLASSFDPNRDHAVLKIEQTRAIRRLQSAFDPHIFVDAHEYTGVATILGKYVRAQDLLVSGNKNPNLPASIRSLNQAYVDEVFEKAEGKGLRVGPYFTTSVSNGTITIQEPDWHAQANHKSAGNYQALTFLVETRGIRLGAQHFQRRVAAQIISLETIINKTLAEFDNVYSTIEAGRKSFINSNDDIIVLDDYRVEEKAVDFFDSTNGSIVPVRVLSQNSDPSTILLTRPRPIAYVFSRAFAPLAERLQILGVNVTTLQTDWTGSVEAYNITSATLANSKFEGIVETAVTTSLVKRKVKIPKGGYWVSAAQKNAGFLFGLVEPEGRASAVRYNVVSVEAGDEYPVFRVVE